MKNIDVSVVLNMHREALFLRPTLLSLEACAEEAAKAGISVELIAVFDRPDEDTLAVFHSTPLKTFVNIKIIEIDVGSLGLARNAGIDVAEGEFIWTSDGDDLVSKNCIVQLINTARACSNPKVAVFLDFLAAFGDQYHIVRYQSSEWLTAADFAYQHPYVSRIFISRNAFENFRYQDLKVTTGFAYEDWDFNCTLYADGYTFAIAPNTIIFYRQRTNSLLKQANSTSAKIIPPNRLFEPRNFIQLMNESRNSHDDWAAYISQRQDLHQRNFSDELMQSPLLVGYIIEAASLDPEVDPRQIELAHSYYSVPHNDKHWGFHMESLYKMIGSTDFSDIVLLPWLKPGGAEKYILQILEKLHEQNSTTKILVFSGQPAKTHEWSIKLPKGSVFIDLYNSFPQLGDADRAALAARVILSLSSPGTRIHLKTSGFSHNIMEQYGAALASQMKIIYYRFSEGLFEWNGVRLSDYCGIQYLRKVLSNLTMTISDCHYIAKKDEGILGSIVKKQHVIYAECEVREAIHSTEIEPKYRLLWSSRICREKRPDLLIKIAKKLHKRLPEVQIDTYGHIEHPYTWETISAENVHYQGPFSNFKEITTTKYDGFIYTTMFDGLPNIILEALGSELATIAPNVGGIPEAVINDETGFLLENHVDDDVLADAYVSAIEHLYADWNGWCRMRNNARTLITGRHSKDIHTSNVAKVFIPTIDLTT